jgi:hypothetical protein
MKGEKTSYLGRDIFEDQNFQLQWRGSGAIKLKVNWECESQDYSIQIDIRNYTFIESYMS